jgi:hypothetical protein
MPIARRRKSTRSGARAGSFRRKSQSAGNGITRRSARLRDRLIEERSEALSEAAEPVERHSLHQTDFATNEFDHELALSQLSAEQDALYEVEAAMRRNPGWLLGRVRANGQNAFPRRG